MTAQGQRATPNLPPDLAEVIDAWPELPEPIKAAVLALVKASAPSQDHREIDKIDEMPRRTRKGGDRD
jgi:hypothetical protein